MTVAFASREHAIDAIETAFLRKRPCNDAASRRGKHPLIGAALHRRRSDGFVENHAVMLDIVPSNHAGVGDLGLIQYFDFIGGPTTRRLIALTDLASPAWVFYADIEAMHDHYDRVDAANNERIINQQDE